MEGLEVEQGVEVELEAEVVKMVELKIPMMVYERLEDMVLTYLKSSGNNGKTSSLYNVKLSIGNRLDGNYKVESNSFITFLSMLLGRGVTAFSRQRNLDLAGKRTVEVIELS